MVIHKEMPDTSEESDLLQKLLGRMLQDHNSPCVHLRNGKVVYDSKIPKGRKIQGTNTEEYVRALYVVHLVHELNYPRHHVEIEYKVDAKAGRDSDSKWVDIALKLPDDKIWALFEMKTPTNYDNELDSGIEGQLFGLAPFLEESPALLVYGTIDLKLKEGSSSVYELTRMLCIDHRKFKRFKGWVTKHKPSVSVFPVNYDEPVKPLYINGASSSIPKSKAMAATVGGGGETSFHKLARTNWGNYNDLYITFCGVVVALQILIYLIF